MKCPRCNSDNATHYHFCGSCGESLITLRSTDADVGRIALFKSGADLFTSGEILKKTYKIEKIIGEGGAGTVYRAKHMNLGHDVAVKVLFGQLERNRTLRERFLEEARIQANLRHPNIILVTDIIDEPNRVAMVMEYVRGQTLYDYIHSLKAPAPEEVVIKLMTSVLDAMEYVHEHDIIHRDIKPQNIMMTRSGGQPLPKVMDFGIAKILGEQDIRTMTGARMGTLHYMAPEQFRDSKSVDKRADIYSLGVTLYELVTQRLPFESDDSYALMRSHQEVEPPSPRTLNRALSMPMEQVVLKALKKKPEDRFVSCLEFKQALKEVRTHANTLFPDLKNAKQGLIFEELPTRDPSKSGIRFFTPPSEQLGNRTHRRLLDTDEALAKLEEMASTKARDTVDEIVSRRKNIRPSVKNTDQIETKPPKEEGKKYMTLLVFVMITLWLIVLLVFLFKNSDRKEPAQDQESEIILLFEPDIQEISKEPDPENEDWNEERTLSEKLSDCRKLSRRSGLVNLNELEKMEDMIQIIKEEEPECRRAYIERYGVEKNIYRDLSWNLMVETMVVEGKLYQAAVLQSKNTDFCVPVTVLKIRTETAINDIERFKKNSSYLMREYERTNIDRRMEMFTNLLAISKEQFPDCFQ